jgi:hypothetical protein
MRTILTELIKIKKFKSLFILKEQQKTLKN